MMKLTLKNKGQQMNPQATMKTKAGNGEDKDEEKE